MAFRKFPLPLLCCFFMAMTGCAGKQKTEICQPNDMTNVAVVATPRQGGGPATAALNGNGKNGDRCLLAMVKPADGPINSFYGNRRLGKKTKFHKGIDIGARRGSAVVAAAAGKVIFSGKKQGYGKTVDIEHGDGIVSRYAHLDAVFVSSGQALKQSDRLGLVGRSGHVTGPNLHFELLARGRPVNPLNEGWIDASSNDDLSRFVAASGPADAAVLTAEASAGGMTTAGVDIPDIRSPRLKNSGKKAESAKIAKTASAKGAESAKIAKAPSAKGAESAKIVKTASAKGVKRVKKVSDARTTAVKVAAAKGVKSQQPRRL